MPHDPVYDNRGQRMREPQTIILLLFRNDRIFVYKLSIENVHTFYVVIPLVCCIDKSVEKKMSQQQNFILSIYRNAEKEKQKKYLLFVYDVNTLF